MATEGKTIAVEAARVAVSSQDVEAIADAQVGLAAQGLEGHALFQQLATAAALLDPASALQRAQGTTFVDLLVAAWQRKNLAAVAFGLGQLGVKASEADVTQLDAALTAANGRRRTELLSHADLVATILDVRGPTTLGRRPPDDSAWRKKETTRSVCTFERLDEGNFRLELGTERVRSYSPAYRETTVLSLTLAATTPPSTPAAAAPSPATAEQPPATLPNELRAQLLEFVQGPPESMRFDQALRALSELDGGPHAEAAAALVARFVASWPDEARANNFRFPSSRLTALLRPLLRTFVGVLGAPLDAAALGPFPGVRTVSLLGSEGDLTRNTNALFQFPALRTLRLGGLYNETELEGALHLSWPQTVTCVDVGARMPWPDHALEAVASRLCGLPALTHVETQGTLLSPLASLPATVEFGLSLSKEGDVTLAASQLGERRLASLQLWSARWPGAGEELRRAGLPARLRRLSLDAEPGGLEAVLRGAEWPLLRELQVHLPARLARMHHLTPEAITFTRGDIDALAACGALAQLEVLDLTGVLGEELAGVLVDALVRARPKLTRLVLNAGEIGNDALARLAKAGLLADLRELELYRCKLKAKGFLALLDAQGPRALTRLVLAKNSATQPTITALASWPGLATVERLDLRELSLAAAQREALQASPFLRPEALDITTYDFW